MNTSSNMLDRVLEMCQFKLEGCAFSREAIITSVTEFMEKCVRYKGHSVGFVLHTGSVLYDAAAVIYAAISSIIMNDINSGDVVNSLTAGDMVLYDGKRCAFKEITDNYEVNPGKVYAVLIGDSDKNTIYVGEGSWNRIAPYKGQSTRRDGRGIRKRNTARDDFFENILGYKKAEIPSVIDTSAVIVMRRDRADYLVNNLTVFFQEKEVLIRELVPASYYTESEEPFYYGGNSGKNEAVLQMCSSFSVARQLLSETDGNKKNQIIVSGEDIIRRNLTEMPTMLKRRSVDNVFVFTDITDSNTNVILEMYEDAEVFACTKRRLSERIQAFPYNSNELTNELSEQVFTAANYTCEAIRIEGCISWDEYKKFRRNISSIRHSDWDNSDRDLFIILACAAMKLYMTVPFRVSVLEKKISDGVISNVQSPSVRIDELKRLSDRFPEYLRERSESCVSLLNRIHDSLYEKSEKEEFLLKRIKELKDKKVAVIVPKAYYGTIINDMGLFSSSTNVIPEVYTANRFPKGHVYDVVISVGDYIGTRFSPYHCTCAKKTQVLIYEYEDRFFSYNIKNARKSERRLDDFSTHQESEVRRFDYYDEDDPEEGDVKEIIDVSEEVDSFIDEINDKIAFGRVENFNSKSSALAEVVALGTFEGGERAFFTKRYKAYVYDEAQGIIEEKTVDELEEGDSLVFTRYDNETRDIVDDVLRNLLLRHQVESGIEAEYNKAKRWKEALQNYMNSMELSSEYIANEMIKNGVSVQESTIRVWLDPDARTVGPRNPDSIRQIAILVGDDEMEKNYQSYYDACANVRRVRRMILKEIGASLRMKLANKMPKANTTAAYVYDKIDDLALIVRLGKITRTRRDVPLNLINRPIMLEDNN